MAKAQSEATQLRKARADLKRATMRLNTVTMQCEAYRVRATKAEQDCADWKSRFDLLLTKAGKVEIAP
jgi:hypothetical protein